MVLHWKTSGRTRSNLEQSLEVEQQLKLVELAVTLCGRIFSNSAPDIPDFSSSAFASALLLPFIRASVWARKLDNKLEHTTTQVRCTLCVLTNETVRHIDTVRRTDTVRRIDTVRQQSTATWQQDVSTVWQPLSHGLHQQCTSKLYQKNETLRYKLEKHSQDSTRSFNNSCGLSTCLPPHTCYHITFGTSSWITWWVSQYFLTPWNPPQGRGPGRPHKLSPSLWPIVPIWEPCIKQYGSQAFALGNKSLY